MDPAAQKQLLHAVQDKPPVIFYHYPCPDGVFAALAASLFFKSRGVTPRFVPHEVYRALGPQQLGLQPQDVAYLLDYAGPKGFPQRLCSHVSNVIVLDHHQTAAAQLADLAARPPNLSVHLDMGRSGAGISRDFFGLADSLSPTLQQMISWVEDADLWRWSLPDSRAFHAGLAALRLEYSTSRNPDIFQQLAALDTQQVLQQGLVVLELQERLISEAAAAAELHQLGGAAGLTRGWGTCLGVTVNSPELIKFRSMLGNRLATLSRQRGLTPVGIVAYTEDAMPNRQTHIKVSLRSVDGFDTCAVSQAFGGGGHAAASSCIIELKQLASWRAMAE